MDWGNVTLEELVDALQEVDWSSPPRPLAEFFAKFTVPKSRSKLDGRVKCNLYYYRANYFILLALILGIGFVRNPLALIAVFFAGISVACLNDSFAESLSEKLTRAVRRVSPPLAAKLRPPVTPGVRRRPQKGSVYICGKDRRYIVVALTSVSAVVWFVTGAFITVLGALSLGIVLSGLHASFRTPNLKARLNSVREEFRAVWRGYSDA